MTTPLRLQRELLLVSEREQARLAEALHDGLGQQLAALSFRAEGLSRQLHSLNYTPEGIQAREMCTLLSEALCQSRELARSIDPHELDSGDLGRALQSLCSRAQSLHRTIFHFEPPASDDLRIKDTRACRHLYRVVQEAFRNAVTHSRAERVFVNWRKEGARLFLNVEDDGRPAGRKGCRRAGIEMMHFHAGAIGAHLRISRRQRGGTMVACTWPSQATADL